MDESKGFGPGGTWIFKLTITRDNTCLTIVAWLFYTEDCCRFFEMHHHAMNGYHPNNGASTSSHNYDDYPVSLQNQSLFNSNHHHHHHHQRQQQSQPRPPPNQWSQGMQINAPPQPMPPQHQPPFNQSTWGNQIPPLSSFSNNMNAMPGFNMNFIPQQVIQEAYALSIAVNASDEPTLVSKLLSSRKRGESYKEALNSLHAVFFFSSLGCIIPCD